MVFLCVHKREHQVPENSIPVEYRIKDEVFIPFIRMKLGDISCLKSVCVGTERIRVIWRLRDCGIILEAEIWKCTRKTEISCGIDSRWRRERASLK